MTNSEAQILITGCYRTGSEYITQLLGNHPRLETTMYITNFMRFCWDRYNPINDEANYSEMVFDTARRMWVRYGREFNIYGVLEACRDADTVDYGLIYDEIMSDILLTEDDQIWAEKIQLVWREIPDFLNMFPDGKTILVVRDPRSVLASFKEFTYEPDPAYLTAIFNIFDSMKHGLKYHQTIDTNRFHIIKYEDVVRNPETTLRETYDYLELSADHDLLSTDGWEKPSGEPWSTNSAFTDSSDEFDTEAAINRWQGTLQPWEVALCEMINEDVMIEYGYETSDISPSEYDFSDRIQGDELLKKAYERWQRTGQGIERYPSDPLNSDNWTVNQSESIE